MVCLSITYKNSEHMAHKTGKQLLTEKELENKL